MGYSRKFDKYRVKVHFICKYKFILDNSLIQEAKIEHFMLQFYNYFGMDEANLVVWYDPNTIVICHKK